MDSNILKKTKAIKSTVVPKQSLGPISDLEKHLPSDWWKTIFSSLYLKTDGDVVENDHGTRQDIDLLIKTLDLKSHDKILDLCCGQGRHLLELARRGYAHLTGIDRSRYLIRLAKKRALQNSYHIKFSEGDARKVAILDDSLDCVSIMGNSFGYFEKLDDDIKVLEEIKRVLVSQGKLALDLADGTWLRAHFEPRSWEWIDEDQFVCRERSLSKDKTKLISREVIVHAEKGVIRDQFYAERLYDAEQITSFLENLEFTDIVIHQNKQGVSSRNQDLGMMAHRMFVTARAPLKKMEKKIKNRQEIVVLMGDPNQIDVIKKNGIFNEEDFNTINRLKQALGTLKDYSFKIVNNHKTFIQILQNQKPSFVLNLCDEGYNNNARMELHVPALLEMMEIPYSGATPVGLAICYDKAIVRSIAMNLDIPVPEETYFDPTDQATTIPSTFPAFVKPNMGDSSFGISKEAVVHNADELVNYVQQLQEKLENGAALLIQEFLPGDEYSVSIFGNQGDYTIFPILKVNYDKLPFGLPKLLGYESKWLPESDYWKYVSYEEASLSEEESRKLIDYSIKMFERTGCRDYARFDFRADKHGIIKLLEVNPNPGWCWDGKFNMMAQMHGLSYEEMLASLIKISRQRYKLDQEQQPMMAIQVD
ncbi:methyltransferase domain-containing protein [Candidatus Dependentiae bacterium]|nr:methyltransferase domain-containing protein [Candidatus Dependentiae bacterium]